MPGIKTVLIAPNAFKGSLSVLDACKAFSTGVRSVLPSARLDLMPIADGGDGLLDALVAAKGGRLLSVGVTGPLGERRQASYALLRDGSACIEMARASGLALVPPGKRDALKATSRGTGDLIAAAIARGAKRIVVGLGGTASSDGGAGMAQALGFRLLDRRGQDLPPGADALLELARIETPRKPIRARVVGVTDVTNPLLGPKGSAAVYSPQKGATPAQARLIEKALKNYARVVKRDLGVNVNAPRAGAAGGLGAGLLAFLDAELVGGAAYVLEAAGAAARLRRCDAVLTGEGKLDSTSLFGKAPVELARLAKSAGVPVAAVCGQVASGLKPRAFGLAAAVSLADAGASPKQAMAAAAKWAAKGAALAVKSLGLALLLCGVARAADFSEIDALYFARHEPGKLEKTLELLQKAEGPQADWRRCRSLVRLGERKKERKERLADFKAAEQAGEKAVKAAPDSPEAHFWLGVSHGRRGQTQGMMKSLFLVGPIKREMERTLELDPNHGGAHNVLGELYWQLPGFAGGDKKRAVAEFEKALQLSPRYSANHVPLAEVYLKLGRKEDARKVLDALAALKDPADPAQFPDDLKDGEELRKKL